MELENYKGIKKGLVLVNQIKEIFRYKRSIKQVELTIFKFKILSKNYYHFKN